MGVRTSKHTFGFSAERAAELAAAAVVHGRKPMPVDPPLLDDPTDAPWEFVSSRELAKPVPPMNFLIKGVWAAGSHGVVGGEKKSFKSFNEIAFALAVASGRPYLGKFPVETPGPVVMFVGEDARSSFTRRYQRIAQAAGIGLDDLGDVPVEVVFDRGSLAGEPFKDAVRRALDIVQPVVVVIDPLYPYHPADIEVSNLYARGRMLNELSALVGYEAALRVVDHFRKTNGSALDLDSIAQAGMGPWADSWSLQRHAVDPDVESGHFVLDYEFGSRQWGGRRWTVTWDIGSFDVETGQHVGDVAFQVEPSDYTNTSGRRNRGASTALDYEQRALQILGDADPFTYSTTGLVRVIGGSRDKAWAAVRKLKESGAWIVKDVKDREGSKMVSRARIGPAEPIRLTDPGRMGSDAADV